MKLRNIWFSFFQGMLKSSFVGGYWGVPLRVGLSVTSPRRAVGFPLQSLTWVKGALPFGFIFRNMGCFLHSVRSRPLRQAAWPKPDIGAEGQTEHIRPYRYRHIPFQTIAFEDEEE